MPAESYDNCFVHSNLINYRVAVAEQWIFKSVYRVRSSVILSNYFSLIDFSP